MGVPLSTLLTSSKTILKKKVFGLAENANTVTVRSISLDSGEAEILATVGFKGGDSDSDNKNSTEYYDHDLVIEESLSLKPEKLRFETTFSFKNLVLDGENFGKINNIGDEFFIDNNPSSGKSVVEKPAVFLSPRPVSELDAAAVKVQKVYKSYRTRRNLADCAVVVEELWWKALDFAELKRSSVSFFNNEKRESAVSRWVRARTRVAKVGKGLCKDEKAQKLAIRHWLEAIDPRHRYGHNLHLYYDVWFCSLSSQPFFYWLDVGDGKEVNLEKCPRTELQCQCIKYLGPNEREAYEVIIESGKLVYKQSGMFVETDEGSKWIFVLSTSRNLYVGQKKKGQFQHSSFLAGAATTAAGRMVAHDGVIKAIWPYSGHYHPTEENFREFIGYLEEHQVDLTNVKKCAIDDDDPFLNITTDGKPKSDSIRGTPSRKIQPIDEESVGTKKTAIRTTVAPKVIVDTYGDKGKTIQSPTWTSGAGPRIGCVREYPIELQFQALEQVNLSPRVTGAPFSSSGPIPSPRPSPRIHLSTRLANIGLTSPKGTCTYC